MIYLEFSVGREVAKIRKDNFGHVLLHLPSIPRMEFENTPLGVNVSDAQGPIWYSLPTGLAEKLRNAWLYAKGVDPAFMHENESEFPFG